MAPRKQPPQASPVLPLPDPPIVSGPYRALPRTTGGYVVYDERRELGKRSVRFCTSESAARVAVTELGNAFYLAEHK